MLFSICTNSCMTVHMSVLMNRAEPAGVRPSVIMSMEKSTVVDNNDISSVCDDATGTSSMGGAQPGRGQLLMGGAIHVHNESSASGQAPEEEGPGRRVQRSQLRLAPPSGIPFVL